MQPPLGGGGFMLRVLIVLGLPLLLAACASGDTPATQAAAPAGPSVISGAGSGAAGPSSFGSPMVAGPPGCAGPISQYQQIIDSDAETGALNPGVYNRVSTDLEGVKRACAEGREKDALSQLASVKSRYGYR
jgi:hypothetical protein